MNTITWTQHAIGHGGFHTGRMVGKDGVCFSWIFDCGSQNSKQFNDYLQPWTIRQVEPVDWLFISHFDFDHVSGLDTLMSHCLVRDVMIPYIDDSELTYVLLGEIARGNLDRVLVNLVADPATFFLSRGATRITFLNGRSPEEQEGYEDSEILDGPDEPTSDGDDRHWTERFSKHITELTTPAWARSTAGPSRVGVVDGGTCTITITQGSIGLRLKPYRAPIPQLAHQGLLADVQSLVGKTLPSSTGRPGLRGLAYAIALHARTVKGRKELQGLHKKYAGSSNRASLSLLSEPISICSEHARCDVGQSFDFDLRFWGRSGAWMNTGDAELLTSADLSDWGNCYSAHLNDIRVLALPHHGSDKNSDKNLQALCPNSILTAHAKSTSKKHPGPGVSSAAGGRLSLVSEVKSAAVSMRFRSC